MTAEDWKRKSVCHTCVRSRDSRRNTGAKTNLEVLGDLTNETLEGQLADQELSGLLVTPGREV